MTANRRSRVKPLGFGRASRILFGVAALAWVFTGTLDVAPAMVVAFLGVSFIVGGLMANPGCEITALPNLVLPREKRLHSW